MLTIIFCGSLPGSPAWLAMSWRIRLSHPDRRLTSRISLRFIAGVLGATTAWGAAAVASAPDPANSSAESAEGSLPNNTGDLDEVLVYGRGEKRIGTASAASEGAIAGADLSVRPLLRVAELLEAVPGLIAAQHSGSGKANQYFLRGFNLDHGTDLALDVDGVPVNLPSHAHGQGYADLNFLTPELVERVDFEKGPYDAAVGDFGSAGAFGVHYYDRLPAGVATIDGGQSGYLRAMTANNASVADGNLIYSGALEHNDGPWTR